MRQVEPGDNEIFHCPHCGAPYRMTVERVPDPVRGEANCLRCGKVMSRWELRDVPHFTLLDLDPDAPG